MNPLLSLRADSQSCWGSFISWKAHFAGQYMHWGTPGQLITFKLSTRGHVTICHDCCNSPPQQWLLPPVMGFPRSDLLNLRNLIPSWLNGSFISDTHEAGLRFWWCVRNSNLAVLFIFLEWSPGRAWELLTQRAGRQWERVLLLCIYFAENSPLMISDLA